MADNTDDLIISISTDQATLRRSIKRIEQDLSGLAGSVQKQFATVGKSIDNSVSSSLQNRINGMVGVGTKAAKEWTGALADQGKELERLRAKYSPLFQTITQYKTAVSDIKRAHAIGAISANEMATAISKERQAALASTAAIKGRNAALADTPTQRSHGGSFNTANIAAQFQDIAVTSAMGMSPLQIALQQGTQISAVLGPLGAAGAVKSLGAAFLSIISPVSLVTIGLVAGSAAAIQYFSSVASGGAESEETLKKEDELIQRVVDKWGDALPELKKYVDARQKLLDAKEQKDASAAEASRQWTELRKTVGDTKVTFADVVTQLQAAGAETESISALQREFNALTGGIANGTAKAEMAKTVQETLANFATQTGIPAIAEFAKTFDGWAASIDGVATAAAKINNGPLFNENLAKSQLPVLGTVGPVYSSNGQLITDPNAIDRYNKEQADNRNPSIDMGNGRSVAPPIPEKRPNIELEGLSGEAKEVESAAEKIQKAYDSLLTSSQDRNEQVQLEIQLMGQSANATDAARYALELMQQAQKKGLDPQQTAEIQKQADLYKQLADQLSRINLSQDLNDQARFSVMSSRQQQIVQMQRQYGLSEDPNSSTGKEIGNSLDRQGLQDSVVSFANDFKEALLSNGGDIGKALAQSLGNALLSDASKLWESLFKQIGGALAGAVYPSGGAGAGVVSAITSAAPVGAVARSPLGDVGSYAGAIKSIESGGNYGAIGPVTKSGDRALGAYQVMGANVPSWTKEALGKSMTASEFLTDKGAQDAVFNNKFGSYANKYGSSGAAQAWFGGPGSVGKGGMGTDILGTSGTEYVTKFNDALGGASKNLDGFGSGLGKLGQSLGSSAFPGAPQSGGGGGFGWLSSLFGGAFKPIGAQATKAASGSIFGLFADGGTVRGPGTGTSDSIPTMLSNEEFVVNSKQSKKHRALLHAINNGTIGHMAAGGVARSMGAPTAPRLSSRAANNGGSNEPGILQVQINGANGDDHVRMLVKQGVGEGLGQYNENQRRGGFGSMQQRYTSQKG
jgi:hypothetical protein